MPSLFRSLPAALIAALAIVSCQSEPPRLRHLGNFDLRPGANGQTDTVWQQVPAFAFTDQSGHRFTNADVAGKIYVADFFFASCPTICPVIKKEEIRLWQRYKDDPRVVFVSHSIDPRHDSVSVLREYAERLGVANSNWHFVRGPQDSIFAMSEAYLLAAQQDSDAAGGFTHSPLLTLVDPHGYVRASISPRTGSPAYDGLNAQDVDRLIRDVGALLAEEFPQDPQPKGAGR